MAEYEQTTYAELADVLESMPLILRETRRARGMSLRAVARELDISFSTVTRFEKREDGALMSTVLAVMRWIDQTRAAAEEGRS